jgi:hypothetical protein
VERKTVEAQEKLLLKVDKAAKIGNSNPQG